MHRSHRDSEQAHRVTASSQLPASSNSGHQHSTDMQSLSAEIKYYHHGRFSVAGGILPDAVTAYQTYGDPQNPCIVFPTCYGAKLSLGSKSKEYCNPNVVDTSAGQDYLVGEGKVILALSQIPDQVPDTSSVVFTSIHRYRFLTPRNTTLLLLPCSAMERCVNDDQHISFPAYSPNASLVFVSIQYCTWDTSFRYETPHEDYDAFPLQPAPYNGPYFPFVSYKDNM